MTWVNNFKKNLAPLIATWLHKAESLHLAQMLQVQHNGCSGLHNAKCTCDDVMLHLASHRLHKDYTGLQSCTWLHICNSRGLHTVQNSSDSIEVSVYRLRVEFRFLIF